MSVYLHAMFVFTGFSVHSKVARNRRNISRALGSMMVCVIVVMAVMNGREYRYFLGYTSQVIRPTALDESQNFILALYLGNELAVCD